MRFCLALLIACLFLSVPVTGEDTRVPRTVRALRIDTLIRVDAVLDEQAWKHDPVSGFIQSQPDDGRPASERTEVWVAYDREAMYFAARLHDRNAELIRQRLGRRDDPIESDWFIIALDPYKDGRSGYQFAINPAGSIRDAVLYNDENGDSTWDGVWESAARVDASGWTVEARIPFSQMRFRSGGDHAWGVYFQRQIQRRNEVSGLTWIPREESGYVSRFSRLVGIRGVRQGSRVELIPYAVAKADYSPAETGDPFHDGSRYTGNLGMDARISLTSTLTLNLTVNPDFGQVEVDPAQINLTAAENYYFEKRPFFVEGNSIFRFGVSGTNRFMMVNWPEPTFFYSRRIGRSPQYSPDAPYTSIPGATTILAAAKITGKVGRDWNLGMMHAVTQRENASLMTASGEGSVVVEPSTYYGVFRLVREFGEGRHGLGVISSMVLRNLEDPHLEDFLMDRALMLGLDGWTLLGRERTWSLSAWWGGTRVSGSRIAVSRLQTAYPHYFHRPDADHVKVDVAATSLSGWSGRITLNKQKGNIMFNASIGAISPGFDIRDLGFQWNCDLINGHIMAGYRSFKVGRVLRYWEIELTTQRNYNFDGAKTGDQALGLKSGFQFLNYWEANLEFTKSNSYIDVLSTRGGVSMSRPGLSSLGIGLQSDKRNPLVAEAGFAMQRGSDGSRVNQVSFGLEWKSGTNVTISMAPGYTEAVEPAQWIHNITDPLMTATSGTRHIFGRLEQRTISCDIRVNWIFSPRLSLQAYVQPFISAGEYGDIKELAGPGVYAFNSFGINGSILTREYGFYNIDPDGSGPAGTFVIANPDFNFKSLRGTVVVRWEYRPGSVIFLVWTQNRADYADPGDLRLGRDLGNLFRARGDNIFMLKATYRFKL